MWNPGAECRGVRHSRRSSGRLRTDEFRIRREGEFRMAEPPSSATGGSGTQKGKMVFRPSGCGSKGSVSKVDMSYSMSRLWSQSRLWSMNPDRNPTAFQSRRYSLMRVARDRNSAAERKSRPSCLKVVHSHFEAVSGQFVAEGGRDTVVTLGDEIEGRAKAQLHLELHEWATLIQPALTLDVMSQHDRELLAAGPTGPALRGVFRPRHDGPDV